MRLLDSRLTSIALLLACAASAGAQQRPPVRPLGATSATASETFANIAGIRALSNGSVLVNDPTSRRVVLLDSRLSSATVVADSTAETANAYGGIFAGLLAYRGDSSLIVDPASVSMLVIDETGKVARVMAIPRAEDAMSISGRFGGAAFDPAGRLVYRAAPGMQFLRNAATGAARMQIQGSGSGTARPAMPQMPEPPDSAFIVAINLATRQVDTVGYIRTPKIKLEMQQTERGFSMQSILNPLPVVDDWAVVPDGSVAFVRGKDYRIDWAKPDGTTSSSAKIPFDWKRLTDEDKVAFLDSLKAAREWLGPNAPMVVGGGMPGQGGGAGGGTPQVMVFTQTTGGGGGHAPPPQSSQGGPSAPQAAPPIYVPANELPDYQPAFFAGATRADTEGNLWIRTIPTTAIPGGPVYDVINGKGEITERVQVPEGRAIIGFGAGGAVYLVHQEGSKATLERATVR